MQARVTADERTYALIGVPAPARGADAILVLTDISERERRERAEREFVANAAHELGTPLTAITTSLEVLRAGAKDDPAERDRFLELIERQTSRLGRLRRALLTLARAQTRQEALQLEPVTMRPLLEAVADELRAGAPEAEITVEAPDDLALLAHPELIEQVVVNLAGNALRQGAATRVDLVARTLAWTARGGRGAGQRHRHPRRRPRPPVRPLLPRLGAPRQRRLRPRSRDRPRGRPRPRRHGRDHVAARARHRRPHHAGPREGSRRMSPRILLADDEPDIVTPVSYALRADGFDVDTVGDGEQALLAARTGDYDLVILDVMMPKLQGTEVCRVLRLESIVPIIMLTAKDAEIDRVLGLELGADDYVTKPFSTRELSSRIRAVLRRRDLERSATAATVAHAGDIAVDLASHRVTVAGREVRLTPSEFKVLALLVAEPNRVFSRWQIMENLWDATYVGTARAADVHVSNLRRKLEEEPGKPRRIVTVREAGYKLVPV